MISHREVLPRFEAWLEQRFVCKRKALISGHPDDDKEGRFLQRTIRTTAEG